MDAVGGYRIEGEVARGGAGVVYRARSPEGALVALKVLIQGGSAGNLARFRREVAALARLHHPGIVALRDAGKTEHGHPYLVMDFVEGESLGARLTRGPLPVSVAVELIEAVSEALAAAHLQGIVHRDVKPDNVLLTPEGRPLLTDFGLAMERSGSHSLTRAGSLLGTPGFMPPEQCTGELELLGPAADVYALGATLYACLTGQPPFVGQAWEVLLATTEQEPAPPSEHRASVGPDLDAICLRCLSKSPAARYADAGELAQALRRFLDGADSGPRAVRRPRAFALGAGVALAVVALGALGGWLALPAATTSVELGEDDAPDPAAFARLLELEQADDPRGALAISEPLLAKHPEHALLMSHVGRERVMLQDRARGMPLLRRALALAPDDAQVWLNWAIGNLGVDGEEAERAVARSLSLAETAQAYAVRARLRVNVMDLEGARSDLRRAEALDPDYAHVASTWAVYYAAAGQLEKALELLGREIAERPSAARYLMRAQLRLRDRGDRELALADLDASLAIRPLPQAFALKAQLLELAKRFPEAAEAWTGFLEVAPDAPQGWTARAVLRATELGQPEAALADAQRAAALDPEGIQANRALSLAYCKLERDAEALRVMDWLVEHAPDPSQYRARAQLRFNLRDFAGAASDAEASLRGQPDDAVAAQLLARATTVLKRDDALEHARRSYTLSPDDPMALEVVLLALWNSRALEELVELTSALPRAKVTGAVLAYRGGACMELGREDEAGAALDEALRRDPSCTPAYGFRAELAVRRGDYLAALPDCDAVLAKRPSALIYLFRARAHMELGDFARARADLARFEEVAPEQLSPDDAERRLREALAKLAELEGS
ncbi:MAG: protein kinase [Planctomycetes bacterium]|nr:protein kinase [Planctomycetota bacterium]